MQSRRQSNDETTPRPLLAKEGTSIGVAFRWLAEDLEVSVPPDCPFKTCIWLVSPQICHTPADHRRRIPA